MPWLELNGTTYELPEGETVVGSGAQANWRVTNADLMPRHFVVGIRGPAATLRASSRDSVVAMRAHQVSGEPQTLHDGDVIRAGSADFHYSTGTPVPRPPRANEPTRLAAPAVAAAHLIAAAEQAAYPLSSMSTGVGRDPSNVVPLRDPTASRFHAEIRQEAGGFALHSMGASGTRVNGSPLDAPRLLQDGDEIEIAFETFRFVHGPLPPDVGLAPTGLADPTDARRPTPTQQHTVVPRPAVRETPPRPAGAGVSATDRVRTLESSVPVDIGRRASRAWVVAAIVLALGVLLVVLLRR